MYSCLKLKNNSILTSFKDQLPCAFVSSAKQMFHLKKLPLLSSRRFCWRSYFEYYTLPLNRAFHNVQWREGRHTGACCDPETFHIFTEFEQWGDLTLAQNRNQVTKGCQKPEHLTDVLILAVACSFLSHELINAHVLCSELEQKANLTEN